MNNTTMLIGRINNEIEKYEDEDRTTYRIVLNICRNYKNEDGIYENDYIPVELTDNIGNNVFEYCKQGDLVGIKGRLSCKDSNLIQIIAEKVTFLSSNKNLMNQN